MTGMSSFSSLEQNFKELIINQCKFCKFDKYLEQNPDFEFPKITSELLGWENGKRITIPRLFGGFSYFLEMTDGEPVLYAEQSSRMDYDSNDYLYFEITPNGSRTLKDEERKSVQEKFQKLSRQSHEKHLQKLKTMQKAKE